MSLLRQCLLLLGLVAVGLAQAQEAVPPAPGYVADIELHTEADLAALLSRAESLFLAGSLDQDGGTGVTFVLHGPVLRSLVRASYRDSKAMVDQAASLSALGVVSIQACRSWLGKNGIDEGELQPFVSVVSYGPDEVGRLVRDEGYIVF